jgi:hypothetical protein
MSEIELSVLNRVALNKRIESKAQIQNKSIGSSQQKTRESNSKKIYSKMALLHELCNWLNYNLLLGVIFCTVSM